MKAILCGTFGMLLLGLIGCSQAPSSAPSASQSSSNTPAGKTPTAKSPASQAPSDQKPQVNATAKTGAPAAEDGWGHVTGKFVLDGPAPAPETIAFDKDVEVCGMSGQAEDLIVSKDGGIANIVVELYLAPGAAKPAIHASYGEAKESVLDNVKCQFVPHVCVVRAGQKLVLKNSDPVGHNVNAGSLLKNTPFNDLLAAGTKLDKQLDKPESRPVPVQCSIHRWMIGYLVVTDHPYVAISQTDGSFSLKNLPAGKWTLRAWQEKAGFVNQVKLSGKSTKWDRGQFQVTVASGESLDLGEIRISPQLFNK